MTLSLVLVVAAILGLLALLRFARGHGQALDRVDDLLGRTRPVDIEAFCNLTDPAEEEFLRASLPPHQFRALQVERLRAAVEYVQSAAHNAAQLVRLGEAARRSPEANIAEAGQQLVDSALRLRMYAFLALIKLYVRIAWPGFRDSSASIAESYQQLRVLALHLGRLQNPARGMRISAVL